MKRVFVFLLIGIFLVSLTFAETDSIRERLRANAEERQEIVDGAVHNIREKLEEGAELEIGERRLLLRHLENERIELERRNFRANTNLTLLRENNGSEISVEMRNKERRTLKIMPDTAALRALERLRLRNCNESNNCTIELKDVGQRGGNESRLAYEIRARKESRLFGLFKKRMDVESEVDAETGEVIRVRKPWWAFLASEKDEEPEMEEELNESE